jgi:hypothetical protein
VTSRLRTSRPLSRCIVELARPDADLLREADYGGEFAGVDPVSLVYGIACDTNISGFEDFQVCVRGADKRSSSARTNDGTGRVVRFSAYGRLGQNEFQRLSNIESRPDGGAAASVIDNQFPDLIVRSVDNEQADLFLSRCSTNRSPDNHRA